MKQIVFLLFLFPLFMQAQGEAHWLTKYDKAIKVAQKENKNVLVYFTGSDWCAPCKKLKTDLFDTDAFADISKDYVLLYVDYPRNQDLLSDDQKKHNKQLVSKLNTRGVFPLLKVLNKRGNALDEYSGYSMTGDVQHHLNFLKKNRS
ncbi:MAG: thioredoxin family protein [Flavobacteriaceae bacterium]